MLATLLLLVLVLAASVTDLWRHKIYNWTTYPGMLAALGLNALGTLLWRMRVVEDDGLRFLGWIGVTESFLGLLVCGFLLLVCFVLFKIGGGDVKLMAMLGAFLGVEDGIKAMLLTFVLGACMGLIVLVWRVGLWRLVVRAFRQFVWTLRLGQWSPLSDDERARLQPPLYLAPSALVAAAIVRFSLLDF